MDKNTSEIAKLTERISRDPKSKLFVPLAEEYKRCGDIEMAIHVLSEGLKNNPGYVTARSFLGRLLFDMGDMASARREFEEVVKAVPDNLLAQKKLGDLHILLGNQTEALKYYKTAHSLNPGDAEISSLVSDLESGLDVSPRLLQQKAVSPPGPDVTSEQRPVLQQTAAEATKAETPGVAAGTGEGKTTEPGSKEEATSPVAAEEGAVFAEVDQPPPSTVMPAEPEEAEEVLFVEPLEEEVSPGETPGPPSEEQNLLRETEMFPAEESEGGVPHEEITAAPPRPEATAERAWGLSDDFTTDTLAELYIAQGFYEKAIDIYERMLADRPDSRGLKHKLERVRSLAASFKTPQPPREGNDTLEAEIDANIFAEVQEDIPAVTKDTAEEEITLEAEQIAVPEETQPDAAGARGEDTRFGEPKEYTPPPPEPGATAGAADEEKYFDAVLNPPEEKFTRAGTVPSDFTPQEYIAPAEEFQKTRVAAGSAESKQSGVARKEIIDRLEHWLKNIKKEI